jgi:hypothetical protein
MFVVSRVKKGNISQRLARMIFDSSICAIVIYEYSFKYHVPIHLPHRDRPAEAVILWPSPMRDSGADHSSIRAQPQAIMISTTVKNR